MLRLRFQPAPRLSARENKKKALRRVWMSLAVHVQHSARRLRRSTQSQYLEPLLFEARGAEILASRAARIRTSGAQSSRSVPVLVGRLSVPESHARISRSSGKSQALALTVGPHVGPHAQTSTAVVTPLLGFLGSLAMRLTERFPGDRGISAFRADDRPGRQQDRRVACRVADYGYAL